MKVKQAAAMVAVQEHEVLLCDGKITNLQVFDFIMYYLLTK